MTNEKNKETKNKKLLEHDFDGIKEYDNPVPVWFQVLFYGTILFSAVYLFYYHIYDGSSSLKDEYLASMGQGNSKKPANNGGTFNYSDNINNSELIALGKQAYDSNCASCHGLQGQGGVGPNLVDDYWIIENTYPALEKVIDVGVPEKGMPGWKAILGEKKIRALVIYIASIQGTTAPNPKKAEGKQGKLH